MYRFFEAKYRDERGITGLETAIILIAFVVVASVFAFVVLSTGVFSAERAKETVHAGLQEARGSMEIRGSMIANANASSTAVATLVFVVTNAVAGEAIDLTAPADVGDDGIPDSGSTHKTVISFDDQNQTISDVAWTVTYLGDNDSDDLLEVGEKAQITAKVGTAITTNTDTDLAKNTVFTLQISPPKGAVMLLQRTTPAKIDSVMNLN